VWEPREDAQLQEKSTKGDPDVTAATDTDDRRVQFDFEVEFSNGGALQGQDFRLDIDGDDISDEELAAYIVRDLRLLMVGEVRVLNKQIIRERHKRAPVSVQRRTGGDGRTRFDLSHEVEDGMITYRGLPAPLICDFLSREQSREQYAPGTEFQIGQISMCSNTGTYVDSPFHRFHDGADLAALPLDRLADLDAVTVNVVGSGGRAIDRDQLLPYDVAGKAVLVHTGWDRNWRTDAYFEGHPFLTEAAARHLAAEGAALVGIDSLNIDDTGGGTRPVHTVLLGAGIPICEHLTNLSALPLDGFRFSAVPVKVSGMGTFPVRAHATI
jgi:arylformamidase